VAQFYWVSRCCRPRVLG